MKQTLKKFMGSGLFLMGIMLLCSLFGVADGSAMTADVITPADGGAVHVDGNGLSRTDGEADSRNLLLDTIDEKVTKIRPHDVVLDTIARHIGDIKTVNNPVVRHYAIDVIDMTAIITTAVTAGSNQVALILDNKDIVAREQVLLVDGVQGYKDDGVTVDPDSQLALYVLDKDASGNPLVTAINGSGSAHDIIPAITADTKVTRMGRAAGETQISTDPYSGVPTDVPVYLQKFIAEVDLSDYFQKGDKEVDWDFSDAEEEAIFDMKRTMNATFWKGTRSRLTKRNAHMKKAEDIYFTGGIWAQAGKKFSFGGTVDLNGMVRLMKMSFTGNASGKRKLLIAGSDVIEAFETLDYTTRVVKEGATKQAYGLEFTEIRSKFGTLLVAHDQSLDDIGMAGSFLVLDPDFLRKYTMGWKVTDFDYRKSGQSDSDGRGIMEPCALALKNPKAHVRGTIA
jgi:hypothetical protein